MENNSIDALLSDYLGTYTPVTYENCTELVLSDGSTSQYCNNVVAGGFAGVDYFFVTKSILLIVCLFSVFKLLGVFSCQVLRRS